MAFKCNLCLMLPSSNAMVVFCITHKFDAFHAKFNMGSKICLVHVLQLFSLYMQHVSRLKIRPYCKFYIMQIVLTNFCSNYLVKKKLRSNDSLHWIETTYMHLFLTRTYMYPLKLVELIWHWGQIMQWIFSSRSCGWIEIW